MASCTLLKSSLGTVEIRSHHAHDSTLFIELGEVHKDVMVIQCGLLRNNNFDCLYVCFCHLQFRWLSNKLCTSDGNHTLSSLSAHSATCFSHSCTSLGLQQSNMSLIKKGHQSISSSSCWDDWFQEFGIGIKCLSEVPNGQNSHDPFFKHYLSLQGKRTSGANVN